MNEFCQHIIPMYPPNNELIFEEWFAQNYNGCKTDRELLPIFPTSYHVNNNYGNDQVKRKALQDYSDGLDPNKKYFIVCQYDDGCLIDWRGKDVLEFNMSKNIGCTIPLICQPHPYTFSTERKWLANFVGSPTHPIREHIRKLESNHDYFISFDRMEIEPYCKIMHESIFTLCPRGYGANSFRTCEALQYGSIPVYISDEFILPEWTNNDPIVIIQEEDAHRIDEILDGISNEEVLKMQSQLKEYYEENYTYEGVMKNIIKILEKESASAG